MLFHCCVRYSFSSQASALKDEDEVLQQMSSGSTLGPESLILVQPSALMDLQFTAYKPSTTDSILPACCETPLMSSFPMGGFFPWPSEFQGTMESSWSKSTQHFPGTADGTFKAVSGLCSSTFSFRDKNKQHYHIWSYFTVASTNQNKKWKDYSRKL